MQNEEEKKLHEDYYTRSDDSGFLRYQWYVKKYFKDACGKKILEIGGGDGGVVQFLKKENDVFSADISKSAVEFSRLKGISSFLTDVSKEKLPFDDQSMDAVIALEVFEHLKSPQFAIEEIQRVLKKNGKFIVSIPNPRTGHKFLYPCLFEFDNFKDYLLNNRFSLESTTTHGICPPFWIRIKKRMIKKGENSPQQPGEIGKLSKIFSKAARLLESETLTPIRPKRFGWSFVYECRNKNPRGSEAVYRQIVDETKHHE